MLPRVVWLLVDGLSYELVRNYRILRPASKLASLWDDHRIRPLLPLSPNCQTPPSLFTIWSGCEADVHGLLGYDVPTLVSNDPIAFVNGFERWPRELTMVWDIYAEQHRTIRASAVPFIQPTRLKQWLLSATDVFGPALIDSQVLADGENLWIKPLNLMLRVNIYDFVIMLRDDNGHAHWSFNLNSGVQEEPLHLGAAVGGESHFALRLRGVLIGGQPKLISLGYHLVRVHGTDAVVRRELGRSLPYAVSNPGKLYAAGALGLRLSHGGQGEAERLLVQLMRDVHDSFAADCLWAIEEGDADLLVSYYPVIDLLSHQLLRYAFGPTKDFNGPLANAFIEVMDWLDNLLCEVASKLCTEVRFIVNSDHGMTPIEWDIYPNVFFYELGWLSCDANGKIDPHHSMVFFHPAENGLLVFHRECMHKSGVNPEIIIDALASAAAKLGHRGLTMVSGVPSELGSTLQADFYLQSPPGVRPRAALLGELLRRSPKGGDHTVHNSDSWLRGVLIDSSTRRCLDPSEAELALAELLPLVTGIKKNLVNDAKSNS